MSKRSFENALDLLAPKQAGWNSILKKFDDVPNSPRVSRAEVAARASGNHALGTSIRKTEIANAGQPSSGMFGFLNGNMGQLPVPKVSTPTFKAPTAPQVGSTAARPTMATPPAAAPTPRPAPAVAPTPRPQPVRQPQAAAQPAATPPQPVAPPPAAAAAAPSPTAGVISGLKGGLEGFNKSPAMLKTIVGLQVANLLSARGVNANSAQIADYLSKYDPEVLAKMAESLQMHGQLMVDANDLAIHNLQGGGMGGGMGGADNPPPAVAAANSGDVMSPDSIESILSQMFPKLAPYLSEEGRRAIQYQPRQFNEQDKFMQRVAERAAEIRAAKQGNAPGMLPQAPAPAQAPAPVVLRPDPSINKAYGQFGVHDTKDLMEAANEYEQYRNRYMQSMQTGQLDPQTQPQPFVDFLSDRAKQMESRPVYREQPELTGWGAIQQQISERGAKQPKQAKAPTSPYLTRALHKRAAGPPGGYALPVPQAATGWQYDQAVPRGQPVADPFGGFDSTKFQNTGNVGPAMTTDDVRQMHKTMFPAAEAEYNRRNTEYDLRDAQRQRLQESVARNILDRQAKREGKENLAWGLNTNPIDQVINGFGGDVVKDFTNAADGYSALGNRFLGWVPGVNRLTNNIHATTQQIRDGVDNIGENYGIGKGLESIYDNVASPVLKGLGAGYLADTYKQKAFTPMASSEVNAAGYMPSIDHADNAGLADYAGLGSAGANVADAFIGGSPAAAVGSVGLRTAVDSVAPWIARSGPALNSIANRLGYQGKVTDNINASAVADYNAAAGMRNRFASNNTAPEVMMPRAALNAASWNTSATPPPRHAPTVNYGPSANQTVGKAFTAPPDPTRLSLAPSPQATPTPSNAALPPPAPSPSPGRPVVPKLKLPNHKLDSNQFLAAHNSAQNAGKSDKLWTAADVDKLYANIRA